MSSNQASSVAIIGMGCRFPGGIDSPETFWNLLIEGGDAMVDVPADRWSTDRFYSADPLVPGKTYVRRAGFLRDPIDRFDPLFFGISPREAQYMDPQQRLLLEVAWESMEEAGLIPGELAGSRTGVFVGGFALDAMTILMSPYGRKQLDTHYTATAASMTMLAARISYIYDFRGPSVTMDTACSSSLVALHYAAKALVNGECDMALAGGVNVMLSAEYPIIMSKGHFLAMDGHCKSFDAKADGYSRGEGCGLVLLKRLDTALRDGDRIHAVIHGTGVNQDGRTDGITVPSAAAQERLIREVYAQAGVPLHQVSYVEAHGTGTPIGDPLEAEALGRTMGVEPGREAPLVIGSVKANIGHLEAAAGVAGIIKACLCLRHGQVPRQIHLHEPNPRIPFEALRLALPLQTLPLAPQGANDALFVGVNSFGYGGTNAHAILSAGPCVTRAVAQRHAPGPTDEPAAADGDDCILPISARSPAALRLMASAWVDHFEMHTRTDVRAVTATAGLRRTHFEHRLAIRGASPEQLAARLRTYLADGAADGVSTGKSPGTGQRNVVFVFTGMGPQWWGMGQALLHSEPAFRECAEACDRAFRALSGWSILDAMRAPEETSHMAETRIAQPANFVVQLGLVACLQQRGLHPAAIVGHSVGEVAAAYVAGALSLDDAVRVVYHRSRLQQTTAGSGTMLAVGVGAADIGRWLAGHEAVVSIAAINSPRSLTLAGDAATLKAIAADLEAAGIFHRFLVVEVPYHSPLMQPLRAELLASLDGLQPRRALIPLYSTVTGALCGAGDSHDAAYWFRNVRDPVLFSAAIDGLMAEGHSLFAEIGPNPVLSSAIRETATARGSAGDAVFSLRRKDAEAPRVLAMLAELYTLGYMPDWRRLNGEAWMGTALPTYQWDRASYWSETEEGRADRLGAAANPLLGARLPVATPPTWSADLNGNYLPWLADHRIGDATVFPAAGYVEACLALHAEHDGSDPAIIENLDLSSALVVEPAAGIELQWTFDARTRACTASSRPHGSNAGWQTHATASVRASTPWAAATRDVAAIAARCPQQIDSGALYEMLANRGLNYGPAFQCIRSLRRGAGEALAHIALGDREAAGAAVYRIHPAMLDAAFQALLAACAAEGAAPTLFIPVSIRQILFHAPGGTEAHAHCRLILQSDDSIEGDIVLLAADGTVLLDVKGLACRAVGRRQDDAIPLDRWMYDYAWEATEPAAGFAEAARWVVFMDAAGVGASLVRYLRNQGAERALEVWPGESFGQLEDGRFQIRRGVPEDLAALAAAAQMEACKGIIHLWSTDRTLNDPELDPTGQAALRDVMSLVQILIAVTAAPDAARPRLYVGTRDARHVDPVVAVAGLNQTMVAGFLRVVAVEQPDLRATLIDIGADMPEAAAGRRLGHEILSGGDEDDVAVRGAKRYVNRLSRRPTRSAHDSQVALAGLGRPASYALHGGTPGGIDRLRYQEIECRAPGQDEIQLRIRAVGLNFKDVLKVLGMLPKAVLEGTHYGETLGMEASAVITAVGSGVTGHAVGDEVITLVAGCLASHVTVRTDQLLTVPRPDRMSAADGATVPIAFMTAYYGLIEAARVQAGETVLIHAAAGGVGMAAIQVAKWRGAKIYATAGSQEKRDLVRSLGVAEVWDSRSLEFIDGIMQSTNGRGVDVILNSISGETMERSFEALAPLGRFIEIGKRDVLEKNRLPMAAFDRSVSFTSLDLDRLTRSNQDVILRLFRSTWDRFEAGDFAPLPLTRFPASEISEAMRFMAQAKHVGKVVVDFDDAADVALVPLPPTRELLRADATYLITGAFGGIGMVLARELAARGARHLVLAGRRGAVNDAGTALLADLAQAGIAAREARIDVSDLAAVRGLLDEIAATLPPLAGVFHAAAVLDDGLIQNLDTARVSRVVEPKALGAWNLHCATQHLPLELFVLFSSATSLIGNPGQASYVAANTFLDCLARQRRAAGLAATAINWGAIGGVGMLADNDAAARQLARAGVHPIAIEDAMTALFRVLELNPTVTSVMNVDWSAWMAIFPTVKSIPRFAALASEASSAGIGADYRAALLRMPAEERLTLVAGGVLELVAEALHVPAAQISLRQPLSDLGIDSLVGVELQTAIGAKLGLQISILQLMKGSNIEEIAALLLQKLNSSPVAAPQLQSAPALPAEAIDLPRAAARSAESIPSGAVAA